MKFQVMLQILFRLLKKRKESAARMAKDFGVSERSIYRYAEELSIGGVPIDIIRGRKGGICLPDTFRLPSNFFTREEFAAAVNALSALYEQTGDEATKEALEKLLRQEKADSRDLALSGNILVDSGTWGDAYDFSDKLKCMEDATERRACLDLSYIDRNGVESRRTVEPHLLIYKQNIWYLYAWCRTRGDFRLFRVGRIRSARDTGERFERRPVDRANLPLKFNFENAELVHLRLAVERSALPDIEEWLGMDSVQISEEGIRAEADLPGGEILLSKLLGFGGRVRVLGPASLAADLQERARGMLRQYAQDGTGGDAKAGKGEQ